VVDQRHKQIVKFIEPFRVEPGSKVRLELDYEPDFKAGVNKKKRGVKMLREGVKLLAEYQARLAAQDTHGVLVVLQALDAAGKDGTIRHVMSGVNPQGVAVHSFKVPSAEELNHDFLWRYQQRLPGRGEIGLFNRSHYEEVLVVRVHPENLDRQKMPPEAKRTGVWERRYREINDWEHYLVDNGLRIVKLFLNLSKGGATDPVSQTLRPARPQLEVLGRRRARARLLGRLPEGVLRDALPHQHPLGALARDPGRPEVVRADRCRLGARQHPDGHRPAVPDCRR
jgi:polyphosphate kinase 2 (PPK2 family)